MPQPHRKVRRSSTVIGRFTGTAVLKKFAAHSLLGLYGALNVALCLVIFLKLGWISVVGVFLTYFFMSIMFPTIFALAIKDLGHHTKKASSYLIMSIVGGALVPYVMGILSDRYSTAFAYIVPMICFIVVAWYGWKGYRIKEDSVQDDLKLAFRH